RKEALRQLEIAQDRLERQGRELRDLREEKLQLQARQERLQEEHAALQATRREERRAVASTIRDLRGELRRLEATRQAEVAQLREALEREVERSDATERHWIAEVDKARLALRQ